MNFTSVIAKDVQSSGYLPNTSALEKMDWRCFSSWADVAADVPVVRDEDVRRAT
jgi:hypothetical protein